jgi:hypothetical protein
MTKQNTDLKKTVNDCIVFRLSTKESLEYIEQKNNGTRISERHFFRIKKHLESDEQLQYWLNHHTRIGFVLEHKKRIDEIELLISKLMNMFQNEIQNKNHRFILRLSERIESLNKRLTELYLGNPVISEIKKEVDVRNDEHTNRISNGKEDNIRKSDPNRIF